MLVVLSGLAGAAPRGSPRAERHRGSGEGHHGRRHAWRHRRGRQPRPDRKDALGRHRRSRCVSNRGVVPRCVHCHVLAPGLQFGQARGARAAQQFHRDGECRAARRHNRRDHRRDRCLPGGRHDQHGSCSGHHARAARRAPDGQDHSTRGRPGPGRFHGQPGRGRRQRRAAEQHHGTWIRGITDHGAAGRRAASRDVR